MQRFAVALFVGCTVVAGVATPAGEIFRLEIGRPIAGGPLLQRKAVLMARPLCCDPATVRVVATAEGFVDGERRSIPLEVETIGTPGVYAIGRQWPEGRWVVNLTGYCAERRTSTSAVVPLGPAGFVREQIRTFERAATASEVDAVLQHAAEILPRNSP